MKHIFVKVSVWIPVIIMIFLIHSFSNQNGEESSGLSTKAAYIVIDIADEIGIVDAQDPQIRQMYVDNIHFYIRKAAHMSEYAFLAVLVYIALFVDCVRFKLNGILAGSFVFLVSVSDEFHQMYVPGRCGTYKDVIIDMCGCIVAIIICFCIDRRRKKCYIIRHRFSAYND